MEEAKQVMHIDLQVVHRPHIQRNVRYILRVITLGQSADKMHKTSIITKADQHPMLWLRKRIVAIVHVLPRKANIVSLAIVAMVIRVVVIMQIRAQQSTLRQ
jgi:hypothetical protein